VDAVERSTQLVVSSGMANVVAAVVVLFLVGVLSTVVWAGRKMFSQQAHLTEQLLGRVLHGNGGPEEPGLQQVAAGVAALSATLSALATRVEAIDDQRARDQMVFAAVRVEDREAAAALRQGDLATATTIHTADAIAMADVLRQVSMLVEQVSALVIQIAGLPCQQAQACPANVQMEG